MLWTRTPAPPMRYSRRRNAAASAMLTFGCMKKAAIRSRLWVLLLPAVSTRLITSSETSGVFQSNTSEVGAAVCVFDWNTLLLSSISDICSKATAAGFSGSAAVWLFNK